MKNENYHNNNLLQQCCDVRKNHSFGSYKTVEYIVVDGNSNDRTLDLIKKHQNTISQWISEPDKELYDAMNKGIALISEFYYKT